MEKIYNGLIANSKSALFATIEIHNKPIFPYRYEVCVILGINSWELLLKAYLIKYRKDIRIVNNDGSTKSFEDCLTNVLSTIGKDFLAVHENLSKLYEYRCNIIHFYEENVDIVLYSLLSKSVILFYEFMLTHFGIDIAQETNLILLPIGFNRPISPIDFISDKSILNKSSDAVQGFIKSVVTSIEKLNKNGIQDSILINYKMSVINENRVKNADIIAAITNNKADATICVEKVISNFHITNDENAPTVKIQEETLFSTVYTETYQNIRNYCARNFSDYKLNKDFHSIMKTIKVDPNLHKVRYLDFNRASGSYKDYYSKDIYDKLGEKYTLKLKTRRTK